MSFDGKFAVDCFDIFIVAFPDKIIIVDAIIIVDSQVIGFFDITDLNFSIACDGCSIIRGMERIMFQENVRAPGLALSAAERVLISWNE